MPTEEPVLDHRPNAWTVGDLRSALAGLEDDRAVVVMVADSPGSGSASGYVLVSADALDVGAPGPRLVVSCDYPAGVYLAPRSGTITVRHSDPPTADEALALAGLHEEVRSAFAKAGYVGTQVMDGAHPGVKTWSLTAERVSLLGPIEAAREAIDEVNPGHWDVETSAD